MQPNTDLYVKIPGRPAGVFEYDVSMTRILPNEENKPITKIPTEGSDSESNNENSLTPIIKEMKDTMYPFVYRADGPVELDQFFGY